MRTIIAAAALAVAGTGVSAAVYEYDLTVQATSVDAYYNSVEVGQTGSATFTADTGDDGFAYSLSNCSFLGIACPRSAISNVRFFDLSEDGAIVRIAGTDGLTEQVEIDFGSNTATFQTVFGEGGFETTDIIRFDILSSGYTVDGETPGVTPVPLPASAPLLAIALGGMAWMRRRQGRRHITTPEGAAQRRPDLMRE